MTGGPDGDLGSNEIKMSKEIIIGGFFFKKKIMAINLHNYHLKNKKILV